MIEHIRELQLNDKVRIKRFNGAFSGKEGRIAKIMCDNNGYYDIIVRIESDDYMNGKEYWFYRLSLEYIGESQ